MILSENDLRRLIREELHSLLEEKTTSTECGPNFTDVADEGEGLIWMHKKSGLKYTQTGSQGNVVELESPIGKRMTIPRDALESDYELEN